VRRGCIAIGKVECGGCHRPLEYGEHYLVVDEDGEEKKRLCAECRTGRDHVTPKKKKGKKADSPPPGE
jgi:hypothetical protein